ncbi:hypothetical protein [Stutzerimonas urumqiensis]|uniref:hypothetical protein n=1 Tax=Stutzerimonas urumqiensis TaxID=638269 RepID=UPI000EAC1F17|nr:hypothetical protein [Stutzerimonas urumqiensis]
MFGLKLLSEPQEPSLEIQLADAQARAEALRHEIAAAETDPNRTYAAGDNRRPVSGMWDELRGVEGDISRIGREIEQRDNLLSWNAARENADAEMKAAKKEMDASGKALAVLDADFEKASAKLAKLQTATDAELAEAKQGESQAAEAYAAALAQGSETEEAAALEKLNRFSEALEQTERKAARQNVIIQALQGQVDAIDEKRASERERFEKARERRLIAVRHKLGTKWDAMAAEMAELATQLVAVDWAVSGYSRSMDSLHIPNTAKDGAPVTGSRVRDASSSINVDELRP